MFGVIYYKDTDIKLRLRHNKAGGLFVDEFRCIDSYEVVGNTLVYTYNKKYRKSDPWTACTVAFNPATDSYYNFATIQHEGEEENIVAGFSRNNQHLNIVKDFRDGISNLRSSIYDSILPHAIDDDGFVSLLQKYIRMYLRHLRRVELHRAKEMGVVHSYNNGDSKKSNELLESLNSETPSQDHLLKFSSMFTKSGKLKSSTRKCDLDSFIRHCPVKVGKNREDSFKWAIWSLNDIDRFMLYDINPNLPVDEYLNAQNYGEHCKVSIHDKTNEQVKWLGEINQLMTDHIRPTLDHLCLVSKARFAMHDDWSRSNFWTIQNELLSPIIKEAERLRDIQKLDNVAPEVAALASKHSMTLSRRSS
ncbi:hypothetical protein NVP1031O_077 [Vibrio phage 1.031.O._10N.261.46.F8]|nr:hypothetical protein NVP1031O_077 [Vibrio phage 1.031.O._10N.261.46.F8]